VRSATQTTESFTVAGAAPGRDRRRRWTLLVMCVATFVIQLDVTIVNVALPRIQADLDVGPGGLEWIVSAYALSLAGLIPAAGTIGDQYGRRRVFACGMVAFALGSVGCALSTTDAMLIAGRAVQGLGGAAMLALTLSIITETFPVTARAAAIGTWAAVGGTGFGVGPVAGGVLLTYFGWSSVFWVNVPLAIVGVAGALRVVPESRDPRTRLDVTGVLLSAAGLVAVTLGLIESATHPWTSAPVSAPLAAGAIGLTAFGGWERRAPHAMVSPALRRAPGFVPAALTYLVCYTAFSGVLFYVTLLYQDVDGWSALRTGLSWLFMNVPFLLAAQLAGRLGRRFSATALVRAGCVAAAGGVLALALAGSGSPFALTAAGYVVSGAGFGLVVPTLSHVAMRHVPPGASGAASGLLNAARQIGTSVGLAVLGSIGVGAARSAWATAIGRFPPSLRTAARAQAQNVGGGRIAAIGKALGDGYRQPAAQSFMHGYHLAVCAGAVCLLAAAGVAAVRPRGAASGTKASKTDSRR